MKAIAWVFGAGLVAAVIVGGFYRSTLCVGLRAGIASISEIAAHPFVNMLLALVFTGVCAVFSLSRWKRLDEAQREGHKSAWFWGAGCTTPALRRLVYNGAPGTGIRHRARRGSHLRLHLLDHFGVLDLRIFRRLDRMVVTANGHFVPPTKWHCRRAVILNGRFGR